MGHITTYLKKFPVTLVAFAVYCFLWYPLLVMMCSDELPFQPVTIGEFPLAPLITIPFSIVLLLNSLFRKGHRAFYIIMAGIAYIPFLLMIVNE